MWNSVATKPNLIRNHLSHSVPWYLFFGIQDAVSELQSWWMSTCSYIFLAAVVWAFWDPNQIPSWFYESSHILILFSCKKVPCMSQLTGPTRKQMMDLAAKKQIHLLQDFCGEAEQIPAVIEIRSLKSEPFQVTGPRDAIWHLIHSMKRRP